MVDKVAREERPRHVEADSEKQKQRHPACRAPVGPEHRHEPGDRGTMIQAFRTNLANKVEHEAAARAPVRVLLIDGLGRERLAALNLPETLQNAVEFVLNPIAETNEIEPDPFDAGLQEPRAHDRDDPEFQCFRKSERAERLGSRLGIEYEVRPFGRKQPLYRVLAFDIDVGLYGNQDLVGEIDALPCETLQDVLRRELFEAQGPRTIKQPRKPVQYARLAAR